MNIGPYVAPRARNGRYGLLGRLFNPNSSLNSPLPDPSAHAGEAPRRLSGVRPPR